MMITANRTRNAKKSNLLMFISIAPFVWEQDLTAVQVQHQLQYIKNPPYFKGGFFACMESRLRYPFTV